MSRSQFDDCENTIQSIRDRLCDWGWHGRGDIDLGYPKQAAGMISKVPSEYRHDKTLEQRPRD